MRGVMRGRSGQETFWIDGKQVSRAEFEATFPDAPGEQSGSPGASLCHTKPKLSDALATTSRRAREYEEHAKKMGVPTEFMPDGRPVIRSRAHQKAYLKAYGFKNNDGGYGD